MKNDLFEKAKQAVAEKHGLRYENGVVFFPLFATTNQFWKEVFEYGCNEAVKADRKEILKTCVEDMFLKEPNWDSADFFPVIDKSKTSNRPLPFPQQPDER